MMTNLLMIRHAESPFVFGEEKTRGLSEEGFKAALKVADLLDAEEIHAIVSSTYERAKQTVQHVAERRNLPIIEFEMDLISGIVLPSRIYTNCHFKMINS